MPTCLAPAWIGVPLGGARAVELQRQDAAACRAAMLHARDDLLADIAALGETDALQLVEIGLVRKELARSDIGLAVGDAKPYAPRRIFAVPRRNSVPVE